MEAAVDFDIIAHFGKLRNIDLSQRGIYYVQLKLFYGHDSKQLVNPVGVFSAPSTVDSFVKSMRVTSIFCFFLNF